MLLAMGLMQTVLQTIQVTTQLAQITAQARIIQTHKTTQPILLMALAKVKTLPSSFPLHKTAAHPPIPLTKNTKMKRHRSCFQDLSIGIKYYEHLTINYLRMDDLDN